MPPEEPSSSSPFDITPTRPDVPADAPSPEDLEDTFHVVEVRADGDRIYYFGRSRVDRARIVQNVWPTFQRAGYEVEHRRRGGADVLVAERGNVGVDGIPWTNVVLFVLTVFSTLVAGAMWFYIDPVAEPSAVWKAWPFTVAVMTVLGVHELGHYVMSRYHGVDASLPYFIPVPTLIGTMGAVIKMKGHMPDRKALFDIGVAGPLAGLVATVAVTVVGLHLDPVVAPQEVLDQEDAVEIAIGFPPLLEFLAWVTDQPLYYDDARQSVHPMVIGGWVGMFVTFLNMIPVGQLDGGHVLRAIAGPYQETVAAVVPVTLFGLAGYLHLIAGYQLMNVTIWIVWGFFALAFLKMGSARPIDDESELGRGRVAVGVITFLLGLACFAPVPIAIIG